MQETTEKTLVEEWWVLSPRWERWSPEARAAFQGGPWKRSILPCANNGWTRLGLWTGGEEQADWKEALVSSFLNIVTMAPTGNVAARSTAFPFPFLTGSYHISTLLVSHARKKITHEQASVLYSYYPLFTNHVWFHFCYRNMSCPRTDGPP